MNPRPAPARLPLSLAALVLVAFALSGVMTGVLARGFTGDLTGSPTPPTATVASVRTPARPQATATPTQQIIDHQAASAFSAIYLTAAADSSCSSARNRTAFDTGQLVFINLCVAQSAPVGAFSVVLRHMGATQLVLYRDQVAQAGHEYSQARLVSAAGQYDMLVTFNGNTAKDLAFTVS